MSESDKRLMLDLKNVIARFIPDATIILYGSAARGKREPDSDYDVLVLLDTPVPKGALDEMDSAIYDLELEREVVLSVMTSTQEKWNTPISRVSPYHRNVEREGVLL